MWCSQALLKPLFRHRIHFQGWENFKFKGYECWLWNKCWTTFLWIFFPFTWPKVDVLIFSIEDTQMPRLCEAESSVFASSSTSDWYLFFVCHSFAGKFWSKSEMSQSINLYPGEGAVKETPRVFAMWLESIFFLIRLIPLGELLVEWIKTINMDSVYSGLHEFKS